MTVVCHVCNKAYASKNSLASHTSRYHSKKSKRSKKTAIICRICNTMYASKYSLANHISQYHYEEAESETKTSARRQYVERIFIDLLRIHNMFLDNDREELETSIQELRHAASAVLTLSNFKREIPYEKDLLHELSAASIYRGEELLYQQYNKLKRVFKAMDPIEIKKFIKKVITGIIPISSRCNETNCEDSSSEESD